MRSYTATVRNTSVGGVYTVSFMAESYNTAVSQAQAQYGSLLVYVQS
jgi:hypothetical protein